MNMEALQALMLNDSGFAFHPVTGESFQISETGVAAVRLLLSGTAMEDLPARIAEEFDVDAAIAERDVEGFLLSLKRMHLLAD